MWNNPRRPQAFLITFILLALPSAHAHLQPTTLISLDIGSDRVDMRIHIPLPELELAFGHDVSQNPRQTLAVWEAPLRDYLISHIHPETPAGKSWTVQVRSMALGSEVQTQSGPFQEVTVDTVLIPPAHGDVRDFLLRYDAVMHQVVTHKAIVSIRSDWNGGRVEPAQIGRIAVDTGTTRIEPLVIQLGAGSWRAGFQAMVALGMQHIREGTDHLLFLLVLLLPATLTRNGRRWGGWNGSRPSLLRLLKIVTAFTLGHSLTLLAGALRWVVPPQQAIEVLIAFSILITALHALRPIFPGREQYIAAGFGLVHGLAFAAALSGLHLSAGPMALSILGFNLGIELMQLFVVALTLPWLILLSQTAAHPSVRCGGAVFAAIASLGWIVNRISGESNAIERAMDTVTRLAPIGILVLASIAIPAYFYSALRASAEPLETQGTTN